MKYRIESNENLSLLLWHGWPVRSRKTSTRYLEVTLHLPSISCTLNIIYFFPWSIKPNRYQQMSYHEDQWFHNQYILVLEVRRKENTNNLLLKVEWKETTSLKFSPSTIHSNLCMKEEKWKISKGALTVKHRTRRINRTIFFVQHEIWHMRH